MKKGFTTFMRTERGFTLIELLVVISIIAIIAVTVIVNFGSFDEDANLKNMAFDIQSYLRLAQANAQAGVKCADGTGGAGWSIIIDGRDENSIHLRCAEKEAEEGTFSVNQPAYISFINGVSSTGRVKCNSSFTTSAVSAITFKFVYLTGAVSFEDADSANDCAENSSNIAITLHKREGSGDFKTVTINPGGAVDVE